MISRIERSSPASERATRFPIGLRQRSRRGFSLDRPLSYKTPRIARLYFIDNFYQAITSYSFKS